MTTLRQLKTSIQTWDKHATTPEAQQRLYNCKRSFNSIVSKNNTGVLGLADVLSVWRGLAGKTLSAGAVRASSKRKASRANSKRKAARASSKRKAARASSKRKADADGGAPAKIISNKEKEYECTVCLERFDVKHKQPIALVPCGHASICEACFDRLRKPKKCPECREPVERKLVLFGLARDALNPKQNRPNPKRLKLKKHPMKDDFEKLMVFIRDAMASIYSPEDLEGPGFRALLTVKSKAWTNLIQSFFLNPRPNLIGYFLRVGTKLMQDQTNVSVDDFNRLLMQPLMDLFNDYPNVTDVDIRKIFNNFTEIYHTNITNFFNTHLNEETVAQLARMYTL